MRVIGDGHKTDVWSYFEVLIRALVDSRPLALDTSQEFIEKLTRTSSCQHFKLFAQIPILVGV